MENLEGRVAIITGASRGIGKAIALKLAEAGCDIVVAAKTAEPHPKLPGTIHDTAREVEALGRRALPVQCNVREEGQIQNLAARTRETFGRIDILINNAALTVRGGSEGFRGYFAPFESYSVELFELALRVNLTGMFLCCQAVGRVMAARERGVIVNIASIAGVVGPDHRIYHGIKNQYGPEPFNTPISYTTAKSAALGFTRYLATYWAPKNIRVNALSPGGVYDGHDDTFVRNYASRVPMGRMANRDEYKGAIVFLCSDASSYMTGANLIVDGGWTAW